MGKDAIEIGLVYSLKHHGTFIPVLVVSAGERILTAESLRDGRRLRSGVENLRGSGMTPADWWARKGFSQPSLQ